MLTRSGSFTKPSPLVEFDCGSQSTSSVLTSAAASEAARLMAVVVLPTPPFWLATAMTRPMILFSWCCGSEYANASTKSMPIAVQNTIQCFTWNTWLAGNYFGVSGENMFRVEHIGPSRGGFAFQLPCEN